MCQHDVRRLISNIFRRQNIFAQQTKIILATNAIQQQTMTRKYLRIAKAQLDRFKWDLREPCLYIRQLMQLILSAQRDMRMEQMPLNGIDDISHRFNIDGGISGNIEAQLFSDVKQKFTVFNDRNDNKVTRLNALFRASFKPQLLQTARQ